MTKNAIPNQPADTSPEYAELWRRYWMGAANERSQNKDYAKKYYKQYNAAATRRRQIAKLYELIDKYPDEARAALGAR